MWIEMETTVLEELEMTGFETRGEFKQSIAVKWIKAESGSTYLCPVDALSRIENPTEDQLKTLCVNESENPHPEMGG
jgi:hypothetical protein